MNKYCKDALYHAWTNVSPEDVSAYNREYYNKNKQDWVDRKKKREENAHNYWNSEILNAKVSSEDKYGLDTPRKSVYENLNFEKAGEFAFDVINTGKKIISSIVNGIKSKREREGTTSNSIISILKRGFQWLSDHI